MMCFSRESDSESSDSGPVDVSVLGCGSVAGDSDWDSDLSDSDPSRSTRVSAAGSRSAGVARPKRLPVEPDWDVYGGTTEPEAMGELFPEQEELDNVNSGTSTSAATDVTTETQPATAEAKSAAAAPEQQSATKKVTWQFKPAQRSVCTGSRKEKEREFSRFTEMGGDTYRPSPSSSSSSSSSPSSSSSG